MVTYKSMAVTILERLHSINIDMLGWRLGLNGDILQYSINNIGEITQYKCRLAELVVV